MCRQLGLNGEAASVTSTYDYLGSDQLVWIRNASCTGTEQGLEECSLDKTPASDCGTSYYASVECLSPSGARVGRCRCCRG